jgi:hypothetical protein
MTVLPENTPRTGGRTGIVGDLRAAVAPEAVTEARHSEGHRGDAVHCRLWGAPDVRFPRPAVADNNVRCGLLAGKLTRPGEGSGGTVITPVTSAALGVMQGTLVGLPDDAPPTGAYVCVRARPGAPMSGFDGWVQPGQPDYLPRSALMPTGFLLPKTCGYIGDPTPDQTRDEVAWRIDCGSAPDARATLAPDLANQGWTLCGSAFGVAIWTKDARTLTISEASGSVEGRPMLSLRPNSNCP